MRPHRLTREDAGSLLEQSDRNVKLALLMHWTGLKKDAGDRLLSKHQGNLRTAVQKMSLEC